MNSSSPDYNKSKPLFESVPMDEAPTRLQPEEVAPDMSFSNDLASGIPTDFPTDGPPPYEEGKSKFLIIGLGAVFFVVVLVILMVVIFRGKGGTTANTPKKDVTLTYWGLWEDKEVLQPLINEYQTKNPNIKINYQKMSPQEYRERLIARTRSGQGPDIFKFHNTWLPEVKDVVSPLPESIMGAKEFEETFYPVHQKDLKIGKDYYGIPLTIDGLVLIYNDSLLKQAGITTPPTVWLGEQNDVFSAVTKLTVKDSSDTLITSGMAIGTATNVEHFAEIYSVLLLLNGGDLKKLDQAEAAEALQIYRKFAEENLWNDTMPNSNVAFIEGKVAMIVAPSWEVLSIKAQNPDLQVKVAPIPKNLEGVSTPIASYWADGVSVSSPNQLEAWKFLKFLSEKDSQVKMFEQQSKVRLFGEAYSRQDLGNQLVNHEYLGPVIQQGKSYVSLPVISRTYDNGLNDEIVQYLQNAINSSAQGVDYQAALRTAKQGVDQVFEKYKIQ